MSSDQTAATASPSLSTVVAQESETISTPQTGGQGLAVEMMPDSLTSSIIENTVLTNASANVETTALTEYHDAQTNQKAIVPYKAVDIVDANFVFPPGFFRVIERSVPLLTVNLPNTDPDVWPFLRLDLLSGLLGLDFIQNKLNYPAFVRFNLEVQVKVLATNFHFGQIMLVWRPAYAPFLKGTWDGLDMSKDILSLRFLDNNWDPMGPYDTVYTASQLPHQILPITAGTSATMELPWTLNRQYVPTKEMCHPSYHIGYLDVYLLTPVLPVDIDAPKIQVFARFKDIMGFGYRSVQSRLVANSSAIIRRCYYYQGSSPNINGYLVALPAQKTQDAVTIPGPSLKDITWDAPSQNDPVWQLTTHWPPRYKSLREYKSEKPRRASNVDQTEVLESGSIGEYHAMQSGSLLSEAWTKITKTANAIASFVGSGLATLGLSKPPTPELPMRIYEVAPPLSSSVCPDFTVSTGINQVSLVKNSEDDHPEQVVFEKMAAIPTYMGYSIFNNTDRTWKQWFGVRTCRHHVARGIVVHTPGSLIASRFEYWRANFHYKLHFSSSSFVNARFAVMIEYFDDGELQQGIVPTQYVEVKGDIVVEGEVPFLHPQPWASVTDGSGANPIRLTVTMIDDPVSWKADQSPPIIMSVWFAWRGLQVAGMAAPIEYVTLWGYSNALRPHPAVKDMPGGEKQRVTEVLESNDLPGKIPALPPVDCGMNDIPQTAYHLAKRYVEGRGASFTPFAPFFMLGSRPTQSRAARYVVTYAPINAMFMKCYRWVRGSANVLVDNVSVCMDEYGPPIEESSHEMVGQLWHTDGDADFHRLCQSRPYLKKFGQKLLAIRQPFRSNVPYVSGPHVFITCTSAVNSYDNMRVYSMAESLKGEVLDTFRFMHDDKSNYAAIPFSYSYGDDLCYKQWIGCPTMGLVYKPHLNEVLWGPTL